MAPSATIATKESPVTVHHPAAAARRRVHQFYVGVTLLLIGIVVVGFWPGYFGPLIRGGVTRPWIIHAHGAVFSGWMALLLLQVILAATGRVRLHRRVGSVGIAYGALVLAATVALAFAGAACMSFESPLVFLLVWLSPSMIAMAFDVITRGRVHVVNAVSTAVLALAFVRIFYMESDRWLVVGRALLTPWL